MINISEKKIISRAGINASLPESIKMLVLGKRKAGREFQILEVLEVNELRMFDLFLI